MHLKDPIIYIKQKFADWDSSKVVTALLKDKIDGRVDSKYNFMIKLVRYDRPHLQRRLDEATPDSVVWKLLLNDGN